MKVNGTAAQINGSEQGNRARTPQSGGGSSGFLDAFQMLPDSRFRATDSGLKVAVLKEGDGTPLTKGLRLKVNYTGWITDGKKFDSSTDKGQPFEFVLGEGQVIKGWEEGLAGIKPGERRQLVIPAALAYGNRRVGEIPPGSTLVFNVEAVAVEEAKENPKGNMSIVA